MIVLVGMFSLGYITGSKITEKRLLFAAHQEMLPFPAEFFDKRGGKNEDPHRFAMNGTLQQIGTGSVMVLENTVLKQVEITPMTRIRDGKDMKGPTDLAVGQRVNVLGRETPDERFEAMMIMVRK